MSVRNIRQLSSCSLSMHADASLIDGQSQWIRNNPHNLTMHYYDHCIFPHDRAKAYHDPSEL